MSENSQSIYLSANFGEIGGFRSWENFIEIRDWITAQRTAWQWIGQNRENPTNNAWSLISNTLNNCQQQLTSAEQNKANPQQEEAFKRNAVQQLESFYKTRSWLLPDSTYADFIFNMRDSGKPLEAALVVAYLMDQDLSGGSITAGLRGIVDFELFSRGIKDRSKTEATTLRRLAGEIATTLDELKQLQILQGSEFDELNQKIEDQMANQSTNFSDAQAARDTQWQQKLADADAELKRLNDTYDTHMAIAAPVSYWETKRSKHKNWALWSFSALTLCMVAFGWFLYCEVKDIGAMVDATRAAALAASSKTTTTSAAPASMTPLLDVLAGWKIGAYILLVTLVFWFIRLLVRIFLSNIHLENDAAERVTMAKTYIALMRDGSLNGKEHIGTILAALFRPTGDGIVKDEGLPPTAMEWLTKLSGKG